ncbi:MAG: hypothetical protein JWM11_3999, partial [Planctomycetaceae bacterium]|nr:hypothetical protein [Planctomycetaceae bacterium]
PLVSLEKLKAAGVLDYSMSGADCLPASEREGAGERNRSVLE